MPLLESHKNQPSYCDNAASQPNAGVSQLHRSGNPRRPTGRRRCTPGSPPAIRILLGLFMRNLPTQIPGLFAALAMGTAALGNELPAFPGAEGFGRLASGGRGGDVYRVTNLNDAGPGSLREGFLSATGPRTIVFAVSGTIGLQSRLLLDKSDLTIAGQTAPGDGITLRDFTFQIRKATNVIVRYLRCRLGDENKAVGAKGGDDTFNTEDVDRLMVDHCSFSWAVDGTHDLRRGGNVTLQWCILSEALNRSLHNKGEHAMCASYRDLTGNLSLHHNLFSTCRDRHPTLGSAKAPPQHLVDFRNNVIYNWSAGGTANFADHFINCINNVWRPGPMSDPAKPPIALKGSLPDLAKGWMRGNVFEQREDFTHDNYAALDFRRWLHEGSGYKYAGQLQDWRAAAEPALAEATPTTQAATEALALVLQHAGASRPRDAVDARVIANVRERKGKLLDSQAEVGGWPRLRGARAPEDGDGDGMPDAWEKARALNPSNAKDRNEDRDGDGYTNLEEYLNHLGPP